MKQYNNIDEINEKAKIAFGGDAPLADRNKDELINVRTKKIKDFINADMISICEYNSYEIDYIALKLTSYFKRYTDLSLNENNGKYDIFLHSQKIPHSMNLFFGHSLKNITGKNKKEKYQNLLDRKYISKILHKRKQYHVEAFSIHKHKTEYVSDQCVKYQAYKKNETNKYLKKKKIKIAENKEKTLFELQENNAKNKVAEIYNICRLMTKKANDENKNWLMVTITAPGSFHMNPTKSKNNSWDINNTAKECDNFITSIYRNATKTLNRKIKTNEINEYYGVWCKEPHKSGALHQHVLMYANVDDIEVIKGIFEIASKNAFDKINEKWIKSKSVNFVDEDKEKGGSGSSYVFKYIMKSLNASEYETKDGNKIEIEESNRVGSHMMTFNYKRYSFIGISKNLSIWRETRKIIARTGYVENKDKFSVGIQKIFNFVVNNQYMDFSENISYVYNMEVNGIDKYGEDIFRIYGITYQTEGEDYFFEKPRYVIT